MQGREQCEKVRENLGVIILIDFIIPSMPLG
jgi:hypothetical protein